MANILIIHGAYGSPKENWFPWLKRELENLGHQVSVPRFPTPEGQNLDAWLKAFEPYRQQLDKDSIVIGHSLGPIFLLHIIEKLESPIKAAFFVSGFLSCLGNPDFDTINETFYRDNLDWDKIKKNCKNFHIYHSDNDPYVPVEKAQEIASGLGMDMKIIKGAGHFNIATGYKEFLLLLEELKNRLAF